MNKKIKISDCRLVFLGGKEKAKAKSSVCLKRRTVKSLEWPVVKSTV